MVFGMFDAGRICSSPVLICKLEGADFKEIDASFDFFTVI